PGQPLALDDKAAIVERGAVDFNLVFHPPHSRPPGAQRKCTTALSAEWEPVGKADTCDSTVDIRPRFGKKGSPQAGNVDFPFLHRVPGSIIPSQPITFLTLFGGGTRYGRWGFLHRKDREALRDRWLLRAGKAQSQTHSSLRPGPPVR